MGVLVEDVASRLGFPLLTSATTSGHLNLEVNNPTTPPSVHPSLILNQLPPDLALYGIMQDHQASRDTPIGPPPFNDPYNISYDGSDLGSGPSTSAHRGYVGGQNMSVAYRSGIATQFQNPTPIGPLLCQTIDFLATLLPTQIPPLRRILFELQDEEWSTERA